MARARTNNEPEPEQRPQDDPGYRDAGQLYVEEHNAEQQAAEEAAEAEEPS